MLECSRDSHGWPVCPMAAKHRITWQKPPALWAMNGSRVAVNALQTGFEAKQCTLHSCARSVLLHSAGHCPKTVPPLARAQVATECSRHGWAVSRCHGGVRGHGTLLEPACTPCCTAGTQACQAAAHGFSPGQTPSWHCGLCSGCNLGSSFFFLP